MVERLLYAVWLLLCGASVSGGTAIDHYEDYYHDESEDRLLIVGATGNVPFNSTQLAAIIGLIAAAVLPLLLLSALCLGAVALLYFHGDNQSGGGYGHSGYRSLDEMNWEKVSLVDWISIAQEAFWNLDPTDFDCQKKLICEVHQNHQKFGAFADKFVEAFGYLQYLELFSLPDMLRKVVEEFLDAAVHGKSPTIDCGYIYPGCQFSLNEIYSRYHAKDT